MTDLEQRASNAERNFKRLIRGLIAVGLLLIVVGTVCLTLQF